MEAKEEAEAEVEAEVEVESEAHERVALESAEQRRVRLVLEREAARVQPCQIVVLQCRQRLLQLLTARLALERAACTRTHKQPFAMHIHTQNELRRALIGNCNRTLK